MSKSCLVVDDVAVSRYSNRIVAEGLGLQVVEADSPDTCLAAVEKQTFDVILLDWHLRRENGVELIEKIRKMPGYAGTRIIVCSGVENEDAITHARNAGADAFMLKPATREKLSTEIKYLLGKA